MAKALITIDNLTKSFREGGLGKRLLVLDHINLSIDQGEFFVIVGPSGCGKSTLLRILSGLDKEDHGSFTFKEKIDRSEMAFVFQGFALMPWLTVYENIELGLLAKNLSDAERRSRVERELKRFGLSQFELSYPRELSGGMRQRVGLARAFAIEPKVIFMDEPFSALDSFTANALRGEFLQIWQSQKPTIIMVTHNIEEAIELGDRIAVISSRPAKIDHVFANTLPRPRQRRSSEFFNLEDEIEAKLKVKRD